MNYEVIQPIRTDWARVGNRPFKCQSRNTADQEYSVCEIRFFLNIWDYENALAVIEIEFLNLSWGEIWAL